MVAPVVGQQRRPSNSGVAPSQGTSSATNMYDAAVPAGMSLGANTAMLIPGRRPLIAVGAVASDVPTLMSQLVLAGASLQNSLMAGALQSNLYPPAACTPVQLPDSSVQAAFTSPTSDHDDR